MSLKLHISEPVPAIVGKTMEEVGWGPYQYPELFAIEDGSILLSCSSGLDSWTSYGMEAYWRRSTDGGKTWAEVSPQWKDYAGTLLPDGKRLYTESRKALPLDENLLPKEIAVHPIHGKILHLRDLSDDLCPKDWLYRLRRTDGTMETISWPIEWPNLTTNYRDGHIMTPFPCGHIRLAPDGSLWQTHYGIIPDPVTDGYSPYYTLFFLRSTDAGHSWELMSYIPYLPDTRVFPAAFTGAEGYCEADITFPPDGSMVTLIRSGSVTPSFIARSTDGGRTWSQPELFDSCGVWPTLLTLGCGVTVCGYGRPGFYLRATEDPSAMKWQAPVTLIPGPDRSGEANEPHEPDDAWTFGTCSYSALLPLSDTRFLVAYSDFYYPIPGEPKRKVILVRTVDVERV